MTTDSIDLTAANGGRFSGYLALPPAGRGPGLVLAQVDLGHAKNRHLRLNDPRVIKTFGELRAAFLALSQATNGRSAALYKSVLEKFESDRNRFLEVSRRAILRAYEPDFAGIGAGRLQASTLRRRVNERDWETAATELRRWVYGGGRALPELVARRNAEAVLLVQ